MLKRKNEQDKRKDCKDCMRIFSKGWIMSTRVGIVHLNYMIEVIVGNADEHLG